jgi:hypothetical protein
MTTLKISMANIKMEEIKKIRGKESIEGDKLATINNIYCLQKNDVVAFPTTHLNIILSILFIMYFN